MHEGKCSNAIYSGYAQTRTLQPDGYPCETGRPHPRSAADAWDTSALVAHVGGKPSVVQQTLIERACQLQIRIAMMDRDFGWQGADGAR